MKHSALPGACLERTPPRWSPGPYIGVRPPPRDAGFACGVRNLGRVAGGRSPLASRPVSHETLVREVSNVASAALWRAVVDSVGAAWVVAAAVSAYPELPWPAPPAPHAPRAARMARLTCARAVRQPRGAGGRSRLASDSDVSDFLSGGELLAGRAHPSGGAVTENLMHG